MFLESLLVRFLRASLMCCGRFWMMTPGLCGLELRTAAEMAYCRASSGLILGSMF